MVSNQVTRRRENNNNIKTHDNSRVEIHYENNNNSNKTLVKKNESLFSRQRYLLMISILIIVTFFVSIKGGYSLSSSHTLKDYMIAANSRPSSLTTEIPYEISIRENAEYPPGKCHDQIHQFVFRNSKVQWLIGGYSYQRRGLSTHCMLARAAKRLGPDFEATIRIGFADLDLNSSLAFGPAAMDVQMTQQEITPLLFPDSTFESWPETFDYSLPESVDAVMKSAVANGLPGSKKWMTERKEKLLWRGSPNGKERVQLIELSKTHPLLDIESTAFNITGKGLDMKMTLKSPNLVSRDDHCQYRFLLHMNGIYNNRYSSAVKWKMLCGSLVFVPTKPLFVEWWNYLAWKPHVHYVPYKNSKDLIKQVEYYRENLDEAAAIAQRGMELAQTAMRELPNFIDTTLRRYHALTKHLPQSSCEFKTKNLNRTNKFHTLEELKGIYGPTVCA